ncbi:hypothetical protein C8E89_10197 [Mycolicibacterium moriokaense]|uniref:Uncharacterized protein n=1 Tax=Mycolicibacterium moriokaense TaxID=39691 RepID=A0A318HMI7_9MYCO|nr:hypothetical protein C8E89_10197 [Mycolicibacterium moriokaense]
MVVVMAYQLTTADAPEVWLHNVGALLGRQDDPRARSGANQISDAGRRPKVKRAAVLAMRFLIM